MPGSELVRALLGLDTGGTVRVGGRQARIRSVGHALREYRIGYVTENRRVVGEVDNTHQYTTVSQCVIRMVHGEPAA